MPVMLSRRRFLLALPMLLLGAWPGEAFAMRAIRQRRFNPIGRALRPRYPQRPRLWPS
jgi:hypothetical protein